jgi:hypothetical protein
MLIALCGEPLQPAEREVFAKLTGGREREPGALVDLFLAVAGRRSGKSRAMAVLVVYLATLCVWDDCLALKRRSHRNNSRSFDDGFRARRRACSMARRRSLRNGGGQFPPRD